MEVTLILINFILTILYYVDPEMKVILKDKLLDYNITFQFYEDDPEYLQHNS